MNTQEVAAIARPESWLRSASGIVVPDDLRLFDFEPDDYAWVAMCIDCALHFGVCSTAILDVINTPDNEDVWDRSMQWIADEIELRGGDLHEVCDDIQALIERIYQEGRPH